MPKKLLRDRFIAGVQAQPGTRVNYFDTKARGLVLRVSASSKVWYFAYRTAGKPSQWLRLGDYPTRKLAAARTLALDQRHAIEVDGKDPAEERRTPPPQPTPEPTAFTFADFVPVFLAFQKGRVKTWKDDRNKIAKYLSPAWGALPLKAITRTHVHELLDRVAGRGLTTGVNRLQAVISRLFTVALDRSLIDAHPAARLLKRFGEQPRTRVLSDDELRAFWTGLDAQPGAAADVIRLRLLLGQRGGETAGMLWGEIDLEAGLWSLPGTRTKNKRPHVVPLSETALSMLKAQRAAVPAGALRVFPAPALMADPLKELSVIHGGAYTWKDLRRTMSTHLAELGFDETTIDLVLNHARATVTARVYNQHAYLEEKRRALAAWDAEIRRILANEPKTKAAVLRMPAGRA